MIATCTLQSSEQTDEDTVTWCQKPARQ